MAAISFNIPAGVVSRVLDAVSTKYGYTGFLANGTTPQTKTEFLKAWMITQIMAAVREQEANTAAATAFNTSVTDVNANVTIT